MNKSKRQPERGISLPPVLMVIGILAMMGMTFLALVRFQVQRTGYEQATITAGYVAEIGFQQIRAELAAVNGDWTQLNGIVSACQPTDPFYARCQRIPNTSSFASFRRVRENPLDNTSRIIGIYEVAVETGQKRSIFANKTITGSPLGFVPGSLNSSEKKGYDVYGNQLCDMDAGGCPGRFLGVRITAWLTDAQGNLLPKGRSQSVYGVLQLNSGNVEPGPAGYLLESDKAINIDQNTAWNFLTKQYDEVGAFYGPLHTNQNYKFRWESRDTETTTRGAVANGSDPLNYARPYPGVLQVDRGSQWLLVDVYQPGVDFVYFPWSMYYQIQWSPPGAEPAPGSTYTVEYNATPGPGTATYSVTKGPVNGNDPIPGPTANGIVQVRQGATVYNVGTDYQLQTNGFIVWAVPNGSGGWLPGNAEPASGNSYRVRYIAHSPIRVFDRMTYAGAAPQYQYLHEHPVSSGWPLYQAGHGHTNIAGVNLSTNSTAVGADPGYDAATWWHTHYITNDLINNPNTNFLDFAHSSYKPTTNTAHLAPLLKPSADITNYKNQLEQLNKYLQLTLGYSMPRNPDGSLNPTTLPTTSNYLYGYLVGSAVDNHLVYNLPAIDSDDPIVDFRSVYFGRDLVYSAGSQIGNPVPLTQPAALPADSRYYAWIWVNDNPASADYMKVSNTQLSSDYRMYRYVVIPESKVIVVRDAVVLIGNREPQGGAANCPTLRADCLPLLNGNPPGRATIVDGKLTILSFTTTPPGPGLDYKYSKGDIVIVGDVRYRNSFYTQYNSAAARMEVRQLDPQPSGGYSHNHLTTTSINDPQTMWVTNVDGTLHRNSNGTPIGRICGLGLFATHDIKLSVTGLWPDPNPDTTPNSSDDRMEIHGQLIAGHRVAVHIKDAAGNELENNPDHPDSKATWNSRYSMSDTLRFFGTIYSFEKPAFTSYFRFFRNYFYDRSLYVNPLIGAPAYPKTAGDYQDQSVFNDYPQLVQGSWKLTSR